MRNRLLWWPVVALFLAGVFGVSPQARSSTQAHTHPLVCGPPSLTGPFSQPPDVEVDKLPLNAAGEHELILAVHKDGGRFCYRYTWNGAVQTIPPTIRVHRGERFAMRIVNDISGPSKGESAPSSSISACMPMQMPEMTVAHYTGYLNHVIDDGYMRVKPVDTNIHLHGFEGPAVQENIFLSTLSTPMHACEYDLTVPMTQPLGTYFYHPHAHGVSEVQVIGGLSGAWIVEPGKPQIAAADDHVIVMRYALPVSFDNPFAPNTDALGFAAASHLATRRGNPVTYDPFNPPPWPLTFPVRSGNVALPPGACNGTSAEPMVSLNGYAAPATLDVAGGRTQLLRIVNATSDSAKLLEMRDATGKPVPLQVAEIDGVPIAGDSPNPLSRYQPMPSFMLAPAARVGLLVTAQPGQTLTLYGAHFCEGVDAFYQMQHDLLHIEGKADAAQTPAGTAQVQTAADDVSETSAAKLVAYARANPSLIRRRAVTFTEYLIPKNGHIPPHFGFYITDTTNPNFHEHPFWPMYRDGAAFPSNADIVVKQGSVEEWYLINTTMESHVFHIHQMAFVEERGPNGAPESADTMWVPVGKLLPNPHDPDYPLVKPSIVRALLDFRHVPKGTFVFHCHMLFHEDHGMMGIVRVE